MGWKKNILIFMAVIVAVILVILIAGLIAGFILIPVSIPSDNPSTTAGKSVLRILNSPANLEESNIITFANGEFINATDVVFATGGRLDMGDVCLALGDFQGRSDWIGGIDNQTGELNDKSITYVGSDGLQAKIAAVCDKVSSVKDAGGRYFSSYIGPSMKDEWFTSCGCLQNAEGKCCFMALKKS